MPTEYKVIHDTVCWSSHQKAKKIEGHLNLLSAEGWELAALDPVLLAGFDVGFYLVLKRERES